MNLARANYIPRTAPINTGGAATLSQGGNPFVSQELAGLNSFHQMPGTLCYRGRVYFIVQLDKIQSTVEWKAWLAAEAMKLEVAAHIASSHNQEVGEWGDEVDVDPHAFSSSFLLSSGPQHMHWHHPGSVFPPP